MHSRRKKDVPAAEGRGRLFIVSTPIGNLEDVSARALRVLGECDLIAAEDTRHTRKLLSHFDIHTPLTSFYQQQQLRRAPAIVDKVKSGLQVALVSDAGTPGISDPGTYLVGLAVAEGLDVIPVPGPTAAMALLSVSGLPTDRFVFEGFLPVKGGRKEKRLLALAEDERTLIFYESPHRIVKTLGIMLKVYGDRPAALGRELTKLYEEVIRGSISEIIEQLGGRTVKGEITLAVAGKGVTSQSSGQA
jgi:16S rRNA (cytidine1402-2'-O)-methyltransferase